MYVCPNCFESQHLQRYIESEGKTDDCPTCGIKGAKVIDACALAELFEPISRFYEVAEAGKHFIYDSEEGGSIGGDEGEPLDQLLQDDWPIFSDKVDPGDIQRILKAVWPDYDDTSYYASSDLWYVSPDEEFQSLADRLTHDRRFFPRDRPPEPGITPIERLLHYRLEGYVQTLTQIEWFRARRHEVVSSHPIPNPLPACDMGAPPRARVLRGGRANPAGISYLYLGSSVETVIAESRAIPGDYLSVGKFTIPNNQCVVNLADTMPPLDPFAYEDLRWEIERRALLKELGWRLSRPIRDGEHELGYVVTQYLAEFIASQGYIGIIYPSAMSNGVNLVLFEPAVASCASVTQYKVDALCQTYRFSVVPDRDRTN